MLTVNHVHSDERLFLNGDLTYGRDKTASFRIEVPAGGYGPELEGFKAVTKEFANELSRAIPQMTIQN